MTSCGPFQVQICPHWPSFHPVSIIIWPSFLHYFSKPPYSCNFANIMKWAFMQWIGNLHGGFRLMSCRPAGRNLSLNIALYWQKLHASFYREFELASRTWSFQRHDDRVTWWAWTLWNEWHGILYFKLSVRHGRIRAPKELPCNRREFCEVIEYLDSLIFA